MKQKNRLVAHSERLEGWTSSGRLTGGEVLASARDLCWRGVDFCLGINSGANFEDIRLTGHYIGIQLNDAPLSMHIKKDGDWLEATNPPMGIWITPAGQDFSVRHTQMSRWAGIIVPSAVLDTLYRQPVQLRESIGISDNLSTHLFCSLIHQLSSSDRATAENRALSEQIIRALLLALGPYAQSTSSRGGLTEYHLRILRKWICANLHAKLDVGQMAEQVHISKAHFAREFKRATGSTPWGFVIHLRAEKARELLADGEKASDVALSCGFADQAHLCRVIRSRFGLSPSQIQRRLH